MKPYADFSFIVSLYLQDDHTPTAFAWWKLAKSLSSGRRRHAWCRAGFRGCWRRAGRGRGGLTQIKVVRRSVRESRDMERHLDVTTLAPRDRHPRIMSEWDALGAADSIVLVNDHDPVPLYYQFACEYAGGFHWDYLAQGPDEWRVRITKGDFADPGFTPNARMAKPVAAEPNADAVIELDVRPIFTRGETPCAAIDAAVARTKPGQTLVLLVPFEPVPLYAKLGRQGFEHETEILEDGTYRLSFHRVSAGQGAPEPCACSH